MGATAKKTDVLPQLRSLGLDDHECMIVLAEAFPGNSLKSANFGSLLREFTINGEVVAEASLDEMGVLINSVVDLASEPHVLSAAQGAVAKAPLKVVATSVLIDREPKGYAAVPGWVQIRPSDEPVEDRAAFQLPASGCDMRHIPYPLIIEVCFVPSASSHLNAYRQQRALSEAKWLINAFLERPLFQPSHPYNYARVDNRIALVTSSIPYLADPRDDGFSDVSGLGELTATGLTQMLDQLGVGHSYFRVPDLKALWRAYNKLSTEMKLRFLRACANLWDAGNSTASEGSRIASSSFAIEALVQAPKGKATVEFEKFITAHVTHDGRVAQMFLTLYRSRSDLAHGRVHIEVDEPMFGFRERFDWTALVAWAAAKRGLLSWLQAESGVVVS